MLVNDAEKALASAETLCPEVVAAQRDMDLPDQFAIGRKQLDEADMIIAGLQQPLGDIHASQTPEQQARIRERRHDGGHSTRRFRRWN